MIQKKKKKDTIIQQEIRIQRKRNTQHLYIIVGRLVGIHYQFVL